MFCCFVFFKQTTAYEMRISDWSSDVCSSDLVATVPDRRRVAARRDLHARFYGQRQRCARLGEHVGRFGLHLGGVSGHVPALGQDRTSVVQGKSVSVRVDLGGRRIIKKKHYYSSINPRIHSHLHTKTLP